MAESTVIKEFLVALGYKVDESAMKKFSQGIAGATKSVMVLGTAIEATALAVATGVARWASSLEQLYFASQRTQSSADSLKAFDLAARNFGASIDEAQGSVEGLAAFLRNNPGGQSVIAGWLGSVGLSAKDAATGAQLTGTALMAQIGKMFAIMREHGRTFQANQLAGMLGISDRTMLAMSSPGFAEELARQEKRAAGWQKVAEAAHRFEVQLQNLKMQFYQMMLGFEGPAMAALQHLMTKFSSLMSHHGGQAIRDLTQAFDWLLAGLGKLLDWLDTHGDEIQKRLGGMFNDLAGAYKIIKPALEWTYDQFVKLDAATDGWSTKLLVVLATLKAMGATGLITGILGLGAGLAKALGGLAVASAGEGAWAVAGTAFGATAAVAIGVGLGYVLDKFFPNNPLAKAGEWLGGKAFDLHEFFNSELAKNREFHAQVLYSENPRRAELDAKFSPRIELHIEVNSSGQPHEVARHVASEAEVAVRRAAANLVREFNAVVR